jgi:hypothetical protein
MKACRILIVLLLVLIVITLTAPTVISQSANVINACYNKKNGSLRKVTSQADCTSQEIPIFWSITGPAGPQGPAGPKGNTGPTGPQGIQGNDGKGLNGDQYLTFGPFDFQANNPYGVTNAINIGSWGLTFITENPLWYAYAPVHLPQGAVITELSAGVCDNNPTSPATLVVSLIAVTLASNLYAPEASLIASLSSTAAIPNFQPLSMALAYTTDATQYFYYVKVKPNMDTAFWTGKSLYWVRIKYIMP